MPVVDVDGVMLQDRPELVDETHPRRLNAQDVENLCHVVRHGLRCVHCGVGQDGFEVGSLRLEDPILVVSHHAIFGLHGDLLLQLENLLDLVDTAQPVLSQLVFEIVDESEVVEMGFVLALEVLPVLRQFRILVASQEYLEGAACVVEGVDLGRLELLHRDVLDRFLDLVPHLREHDLLLLVEVQGENPRRFLF